MKNPYLKYIRLVALFGIGLVLLSYPLLSLFNLPRFVAGIPLLYAYLFIVWGALILLAILNTRLPDYSERSTTKPGE